MIGRKAYISIIHVLGDIEILTSVESFALRAVQLFQLINQADQFEWEAE